MLGTRAAHDAAERAARESYGKLLAYLAKRCGSVDAAEDALADAFAAALARWPLDGVPRAPEAWLLVAARRRYFDRARHERRAGLLRDRLDEAARQAQAAFENDAGIEDERLGVMFACAHPALASHVRAPLTLQVVLGLDAARIARAFLLPPATMGQRLVRAKAKIAAAGIPLRVPPAGAWPERLDAVLGAIYAAFGNGWEDEPRGPGPRTRGLTAESIALARLLEAACPREPEVLGLLALMLYAAARTAARRDRTGAYVPLEHQDVDSWDRAMLGEAERLLARAASRGHIGRFQLEAAIQSAHVAGRLRGQADWEAVLALYSELLRRTGSPVVAVNRAAALGRARGAGAGLEALGALTGDPRMHAYQPYWATRADLAARAGKRADARDAYARAIGLTEDPAVREYLTARLSET